MNHFMNEAVVGAARLIHAYVSHANSVLFTIHVVIEYSATICCVYRHMPYRIIESDLLISNIHTGDGCRIKPQPEHLNLCVMTCFS